MYFYVAEPITTQAERRKIEEIKSLLSQLGIAGEFAVASPARTVEEHLELAFRKGFTTIVGIGSDALINKVASRLLYHQYDRAAVGAIPLSTSQILWQMVGAHSLKELGEILRARLLLPIDAVVFNEQHACITSAAIRLDRPVSFRLSYNASELSGQFTDLTIKTDGQLRLQDRTYQTQGSFFDRFFGKRAEKNLSVTSLSKERWQLTTGEPCSLLVAGQVVTKTPLKVLRRPKALKLIVHRAKIATDKAMDKDSNQ